MAIKRPKATYGLTPSEMDALRHWELEHNLDKAGRAQKVVDKVRG